jgi:hypothetical protein
MVCLAPILLWLAATPSPVSVALVSPPPRAQAPAARARAKEIQAYLGTRIRAAWGAVHPRERPKARSFQVELRWPADDRFEVQVEERGSVLAKRQIECEDLRTAEASAWLLVKGTVGRALVEAPRILEPIADRGAGPRQRISGFITDTPSRPATLDPPPPVARADEKDPTPPIASTDAQADSKAEAPLWPAPVRASVQPPAAASPAPAPAAPPAPEGVHAPVVEPPLVPVAPPVPEHAGGEVPSEREPAHEAAPVEIAAATERASSAPEAHVEGSAVVVAPEAAPTTRALDLDLALRASFDASSTAPAFGPAVGLGFDLGRFVAGGRAAYWRASPTDAATIQHTPLMLYVGARFFEAARLTVALYGSAELKVLSTPAQSRTLLGSEIGPLVRLAIPLVGGFSFVLNTSAGWRVRRQQLLLDAGRTSTEAPFTAALETGVEFSWR